MLRLLLLFSVESRHFCCLAAMETHRLAEIQVCKLFCQSNDRTDRRLSTEFSSSEDELISNLERGLCVFRTNVTICGNVLLVTNYNKYECETQIILDISLLYCGVYSSFALQNDTKLLEVVSHVSLGMKQQTSQQQLLQNDIVVQFVNLLLPLLFLT